MESVDKLFGADIIDEIDKKTPDGDLGLGAGAADSPDEGEEIVMLDDESLAELFDGSTPFDDAFGGADASSDGGMGFSGIGSAEDDDEGVPVPEAALEANGKKKKDKRTARSQAHAKKNKVRQQDMPESGIFAEDEEFEEEPGFPEEGIGDNGDLPHGDDGEVFPLTPASRKSKKAKKTQGTSESKRKGASISYDDSDGEEGNPNASRRTASAEASLGYAGLPDENGEEEWDDEYDDGHGDYDEYEQVDLPDWADSIRRKVNANVAHAFLLNGNVRDYMVRNISIKDGIVAVLDGECENFDVIAEYDQAHGISFYGDDIEIRDGRMLADAYKERFIEEMHESQERLSLPQTEEIPNRDPVMLFTILSDMFDHPSKTRKAKILLFIDYSDLLVPDASSAQMKPDERKLAITLADIGRSQAADDAGNVMIFITDDMTQLSTRIRSAESRIEQIKIPIPDRAERADFIDNVLDVPENTLSDGTQVFEHEDSISKEAFAINSAGLSRIQIEDIMLRALSEDEPLSMQLMKERKQEIIKEDYDDVLEIIDPKTGFERVGGMELLKTTFMEEVIEPVHAGEHEAVPMGQLLMGPPGSGKTMLCKAVAKEAGMNFVALNLNRIMEKWVGSTERNLDRALDCALAMSPTIIFIDEIDEALPNRADPNASSVNKRINQRLLTFFSDTSHRGEVIILAATNYPEKIDPAFKRAGRFDVRVPMFAPDEFDRMRIMRAIAAGRGYSFSWFEDPDDIVDNPFCKLKDWLHAGNVPMSDDRHFVGDLEMYSYTIKDALGNDERHDVYVPVRTLNILDKEKITLQQLYENVRILMPDLPQRQPDASTGEIDTDEVYQQNIMDYIRSREDILGTDDRNMKSLFVRIWKWEQVYSTFVDQTFRMTGAEMDVIMNKAINLYKKWKRKIGPEKVQKAIAAHVMKNDHDIPWSPFLLEACKRTVSASSGIKQMEDMALINTSDTDFIPDAMYAQLDDGRVISYRERHEELIARQEKSTLG